VDLTDNELRAQILAKTAALAGVSPETLTDESTLDSLGLDSSDAVVLAMEVEELTGREIEVGLFLRFATVAEAAAEIVKQVNQPSDGG
jgi:acyl carrier protein